MFSHLLIAILILRYHSGDHFSFHSPRKGFHCQIHLTREDDKESEHDIKTEKRIFQSLQKVKSKLPLKKQLLCQEKEEEDDDDNRETDELLKLF